MNLAKLPKEERDAIDLHKQVCLARFKMKGKTNKEIQEYLKTVSPVVAKKINELIGERLAKKKG
jgi:predicted transcriptional regulator